MAERPLPRPPVVVDGEGHLIEEPQLLTDGMHVTSQDDELFERMVQALRNVAEAFPLIQRLEQGMAVHTVHQLLHFEIDDIRNALALTYGLEGESLMLVMGLAALCVGLGLRLDAALSEGWHGFHYFLDAAAASVQPWMEEFFELGGPAGEPAT